MFKDIKKWLENLKNEGVDKVPDESKREFLKLGLIITGVFAGGSIFFCGIKSSRGISYLR